MSSSTGDLLVVDAANVVGATPDGWWRDRARAARRLLDEIDALHMGDAVDALGAAEIVVVLEGAARAARREGQGAGATHVVHADGSGDDAIVALVRAESAAGRRVTVVTADRGLRARVQGLSAGTRGPRWLLERLGR